MQQARCRPPHAGRQPPASSGRDQRGAIRASRPLLAARRRRGCRSGASCPRPWPCSQWPSSPRRSTAPTSRPTPTRRAGALRTSCRPAGVCAHACSASPMSVCSCACGRLSVHGGLFQFLCTDASRCSTASCRLPVGLSPPLEDRRGDSDRGGRQERRFR